MGRKVLAWVSVVLCSCGGSNYFSAFSNKTSDQAILEDIKKLADEAQWDDVLTRLATLSSSFRSQPDVVKLEAAAHAGKCGLDFISFVSGLGSATAAFQLFTNPFITKTVTVSECQAAQTVIENAFGDTGAARTTALGSTVAADFNTFMAVLGMVKIGTQLRLKKYDAAGAVDPGFTDSCTAAAQIDDDEVAQVGTGFALILDNLTSILGNLDPSTATLFQNLNTACAAITPNPCVITDPDSASWANPIVQEGIRGLIKSSTIGVLNCNNANALTCCP